MSLQLLEKDAPRTEQLKWPTLDRLRPHAESITDRSASIGGSDANAILSGDAERIRQLWLEKRGEAEPMDLSDCLPVMLGCWTEAFNRLWFEQFTGKSVSIVGAAVQCKRYNWRRCTLDGFVKDGPSVWEAKHTNAFASAGEIIDRYMPQLQHNMAVCGVEHAFLSVIFGNHKYELIEIAADWLYQLELLEAEEEFWECVLTGREPVALPPPTPPRPIGFREVCLDGNNVWASAAIDWLDNREAAKVHANASKQLKAMIEDDVARAFGHGIEAKRSRSGSITIRELKR